MYLTRVKVNGENYPTTRHYPFNIPVLREAELYLVVAEESVDRHFHFLCSHVSSFNETSRNDRYSYSGCQGGEG